MWVTMLLWFLGAKDGEKRGEHPSKGLEKPPLAEAA